MIVVQGLINQTLPTGGLAGVPPVFPMPIENHSVSLFSIIDLTIRSIEVIIQTVEVF